MNTPENNTGTEEVQAVAESLPDVSVGQDQPAAVEVHVPVTETPAEHMPPEPALSAEGYLIGNMVTASHFVPTHHLRIARHSGHFPEGSMGNLPLPDRLQQAWVDQYAPSNAEWRDVPVVTFDVMPEAVSKVE